MVINIQPRDRAQYNDLATLKIEYSKGTLETPNRIVTRHDMNAKDKIGANIPLTRISKTFVVQQTITPETLYNILHTNGYMHDMFVKIANWVHRAKTNSLTLLYPSLTEKAAPLLTSENDISDFVRFFTEIAYSLNIEAILIPHFPNLGQLLNIAAKRNIQLIPILELAERDTHLLQKQFDLYKNADRNDIPIVAFEFATYFHANKGYEMVMKALEHLHEHGKATMMVNCPRYLRDLDALSVSGTHYSPFFMADFVAERYKPAWKKKKPDEKKDNTKSYSARLFCKGDLALPISNPSLVFRRKFDLDTEKSLFSDDPKLQELLVRVVENQLEDRDRSQGRPSALSRVHESIRTNDEFSELQYNIRSNTAKEYLKEKKDMDKVIEDHIKKAHTA